MASVYRVTATWQNFIGAPGYSKFSFLQVTSDAAAVSATATVRSLFFALVAYIPNGATIQVSPAVQEYDEASGQLVGEIVASVTPALITGTGAGAYAGGAGAYISWKTGTIWQGRRVQGRTFLVPMVAIFDTNGTLAATPLATLQSAATAAITDASSVLAVWAKQWNKTTNPPTQIGGAAFQATTALVKDQASQLRSRRQ